MAVAIRTISQIRRGGDVDNFVNQVFQGFMGQEGHGHSPNEMNIRIPNYDREELFRYLETAWQQDGTHR